MFYKRLKKNTRFTPKNNRPHIENAELRSSGCETGPAGGVVCKDKRRDSRITWNLSSVSFSPIWRRRSPLAWPMLPAAVSTVCLGCCTHTDTHTLSSGMSQTCTVLHFVDQQSTTVQCINFRMMLSQQHPNRIQSSVPQVPHWPSCFGRLCRLSQLINTGRRGEEGGGGALCFGLHRRGSLCFLSHFQFCTLLSAFTLLRLQAWPTSGSTSV